MKFLVKQEWGYTIEVEVEADNEHEAQEIANNPDCNQGERIYDDHFLDSTATLIDE